MEQVTGIGAIFFRAQDPAGLMSWYAAALGLGRHGLDLPLHRKGLGTTLQAFPADTSYFGSTQSWMLNFTVIDLEAMLTQLREAGADVEDVIEDHDFGRFGWARDPEGNRFELWQPLDGGDS